MDFCKLIVYTAKLSGYLIKAGFDHPTKPFYCVVKTFLESYLKVPYILLCGYFVHCYVPTTAEFAR